MYPDISGGARKFASTMRGFLSLLTSCTDAFRRWALVNASRNTVPLLHPPSFVDSGSAPCRRRECSRNVKKKETRKRPNTSRYICCCGPGLLPARVVESSSDARTSRRASQRQWESSKEWARGPIHLTPGLVPVACLRSGDVCIPKIHLAIDGRAIGGGVYG